MGVVRGRRGAKFEIHVEQQRRFAAFAVSRVRLGHSGQAATYSLTSSASIILEPDRLRWIDAFCALFCAFWFFERDCTQQDALSSS